MRWRTRWASRWTTSSIAYTEAEIRREHPEAECIDANRIEVELPETEVETIAAQQPRGAR